MLSLQLADVRKGQGQDLLRRFLNERFFEEGLPCSEILIHCAFRIELYYY